MKNKIVSKSRLIATLIAILLFIVSFGFGVWQIVEGHAEDSCQLTSVTVDKNGDWIFTSETQDGMLYKMVSVTVTYKTVDGSEQETEESYVLEITGGSPKDGYIAVTEEKVTFSHRSGVVTVTVTPKPGATVANSGVSDVATRDFGLSSTSDRRQIGIDAEFDSSKAHEAYSYSTPDINAINVYQTYSDGSRQLDNQTGKYQLSGDLFPEDLFKFLQNRPGDNKYNKVVTVIDNENSEYTTTVEWQGIIFEEPDMFDGRAISAKDNMLAPQYARSELNMDGLTVNLWFETADTSITVPLSAFKGYLGTYLIITYYSDGNATVPVEDLSAGLTTEVHSIRIQLTYPGKSSSVSGTFRNLTVAPLAIHVPDLPNMQGVNLAWNGSASIEIGNWDYATLYEDSGDPPAPVIKVIAGVGEEYSSDAGDPAKKLQTSLDFVDDGWVMTVDFPRPGVLYTLEVILPGDGDFQWQTPPAYMTSYVTKSDDNLILQIQVQVDKGQPTVTVEDMAGVTYGDLKGANDYLGLNFTATLKGADEDDVPMTEPWHYDPLGSGLNPQNKHLGDKDCYYYLNFYTSYTNESVNTPVTDLLADGMPRNAGKYYVVLTTYENFGYKSATAAVYSTFNVEQFTIYTDTVEETFARTEWALSHFLTADGGKNAFPTAAPYREKADEVITITAVKDSNGVKTGTENVFYNAGVYEVTLSINPEAGKNYKTNYKFANAKSDGSATASFRIKTSEESDFTFTAQGWKYGTEGANPQITVTSKTPTYYASKTGSTDTDFTVKYYHYDASAPNHKGTEVTELDYTVADNLKMLEVGVYVIELTANPDESYKLQHPKFDEHTGVLAQLGNGTTLDYILPVQYREIAVVAEDITAPTLSSPWGESLAKEGQVYRFNDIDPSKNFEEYTFTDWITTLRGNNEAANGDPIITVTVQYTTLQTKATGVIVAVEDALTFDGTFRVSNAGHYVVTVTLNGNYSWAGAEGGAKNEPYSYYGFVARQQLTVLEDGDIDADTDVYSGEQQIKTIAFNWNANALHITSVQIGSLYDGHSYIDAGYGYNADNTFYVTNAGKYTVSVAIKAESEDNYEWAGTAKSLIYELGQATLKVKWWDGVTPEGSRNYFPGSKELGKFSFTFDGTAAGEQQIPLAVADVAHTADNEKLSIQSYQRYIYDAGNPFDTAVSGNLITAVGKYGIAVSAFAGTAAPNYKLPDYATDDATLAGTVFEITPAGLEAPKLTDGRRLSKDAPLDVTVDYEGLEFDLRECFNYADYLIGTTHRVNYEVIAVASGNDKTVKNANTYTVEITAGANYVWSEVGAVSYKFNFIIAQRTVVIVWESDLEVDYNPDGNKEPKYSIANIAQNDDVSLVLAYKAFGAESGADVTPVDAGRYLVYAKGLAGDDRANYKIVEGAGEGKSNHSAQYTVRKLKIDAPDYTFAAADFNGKEGVLQIDAKSVYYNSAYGNVQVTISGINPWLAGSGAYTVNPNTYHFTDGKVEFRYTQAGEYTFVFYIDAKNYYWEGTNNATDFDCAEAQYEYGTVVKFTVNRVVLIAPSIKEWRTQVWDDPKPIEFSYQAGFRFNEQDFTVEYKVKYGLGNDDEPSYDAWPSNDRGIYYAQVYLDASTGIDVLNYVWRTNTNDLNNGSGYLEDHADVTYYTQDKVAIRLFYAITRRQLKVDVATESYMFGENGYIGDVKGSASFKIENDAQEGSIAYLGEEGTVHLVGDDLHIVSSGYTMKLVGVTFKYAVLDENGGVVSTDDDREVELVNGLPWLPGNYALQGTLHFAKDGGGFDEEFEEWIVKSGFTVKPRVVDVAWTETAFTYNGKPQYQTASITTRIYKADENGEKGEEVSLSGIELAVVAANAADGSLYDLINAGHHVVKVNAIEGDSLGYFVLPEQPVTTEYDIAKRPVTVTADAVSGHVYLDEVPDLTFTTNGNFVVEVTGGETDDGAKAALGIRVVGADGRVIDRFAGVGTYTIEIYWLGGNDCIHAKNYAYTFTSATYEVVARVLEVSWKGDATSVYGSAREIYGADNIDLHRHVEIVAVKGAGDPLGGMSAQTVIALLAYREIEYSTGVTLGYLTPAGTYYVKPATKDEANWSITFIGFETAPEKWVYEITKATITPDNDSFHTVEGTEDTA